MLAVRYWPLLAALHWGNLALYQQTTTPAPIPQGVYMVAAVASALMVTPRLWLNWTYRNVVESLLGMAFAIRTVRLGSLMVDGMMRGVVDPPPPPPATITGNVLLVVALLLVFELSERFLDLKPSSA